MQYGHWSAAYVVMSFLRCFYIPVPVLFVKILYTTSKQLSNIPFFPVFTEISAVQVQ